MTQEGAQAYYDSIFELYASWGVDFVKVDDIAASKLYTTHTAEIIGIGRAIDRTKRPMVLSLSPGPAPLEQAAFFQEHANMWRLTDDFWDDWEQLKDMFDRCEKWAEFVEPESGSWPDCDMLPLGRIGIRSVDGGASDRMTRFTKEEQRTLLTLWSFFRSPLMFGGELISLDDWTLSLLTDRILERVHSQGQNARQIYRQDNWVLWETTVRETRHLALFNLADERREIPEHFSDFPRGSVAAHGCLVVY